jgi:hypothetical protein
MNFVICIYIQMNVILNMAVVVIYCYYGNRRVKVETLSWCVYYLGYINVSMNLLPFGTTKYGNLWSFNMMQSHVWCMCLVLLILLIWGIRIGDLLYANVKMVWPFPMLEESISFHLQVEIWISFDTQYWRATWGREELCRLRLRFPSLCNLEIWLHLSIWSFSWLWSLGACWGYLSLVSYMFHFLWLDIYLASVQVVC